MQVIFLVCLVIVVRILLLEIWSEPSTEIKKWPGEPKGGIKATKGDRASPSLPSLDMNITAGDLRCVSEHW